MATALPKLRDALSGALRGNARALSERELSQTINFARIALIVGLVFLHYDSYPNSRSSPFRGLDTEQHQIATFVNSFVLFFFFSVVPLLSMVSGWLFFSFTADPRANPREALGHRIRRRFVSLYLPLVFWNALFLGILLLVYLANPAYPLLHEINIDFETAGIRQYVNAVFGLTQHPVGFQFWFVRDLFVTALVSPLLWVLLRHAPLVGAVVLGAVWITDHDLWIFFRTDVLFFFYLGGLVRMRGVSVEIGWNATVVLMALYVALVALRTLAPYVIDGVPTLLACSTRAMRLVGVLACWGLFTRVAPTRFGAQVARYGGLAFFLHAAHFPLLAEVKLLLWDLVPEQTDGWMIAHYAASVVVTVGIGISAGMLLARWKPQWFALLNGGRLLG
jgi:surface polysaccharide O-acyltransferase-like enzyme